MNWKFEKGFEGKRIVDPYSIDVDELKTDRDVIVAYAELSKASHWRKDSGKGNLANKKSKQIVDAVRIRLEGVGWHAHIFKTGSCECNCDRKMYLHAFCGLPSISEVPFSEKSPELTEKELFNEDGSLRQKHETLELLRKRIGDKPLNPEELMKEGLMTQETYETIRAIMDEEGFLEVHEIDEDGKTFRSGAKSYTWRDSEDEAEREARASLESDNYFWKEAVANGNTTLGFDDWVDQVLNIDGWAHILCGYDGCSYELGDGKVYWRTN